MGATNQARQREVINELLTKLFEPERRRLQSRIGELNNANQALKGSNIDGFIYAGEYYRPSKGNLTVAGPGQAKPSLHFSLNDRMVEWLADRKACTDDESLIKQTLFKLLKPCETDAHIRNALPECLVSLVQGLINHPRTDEPGWTLRGDERGMRQFNKILPKLEAYSVARLLY